MDGMYVLIFAVFIFVCLVVVFVTRKLELGLKKKKTPASVSTDKPDPYANLKVGQIYQMENGDIAKYIGDGKFLKVKKE